MQGKVELVEALDTMGNGGRGLLEKRWGTNASLYRGLDWQMKAPDTIPEAAGGEGGHRAWRNSQGTF